MWSLKNIPVRYKGELHDIRLVNFTVEKNELAGLMPAGIPIRDYHGKALISMVDVKLKKMHPTFIPEWCHFNYRHVAFRLLINDSERNNGIAKGIYFLRSFTNNPLIVAGGKVFTNYNLENAHITEVGSLTNIAQKNNFIRYEIDDKIIMPPANSNLKDTIASLDRAYSYHGDKVRMTKIVREKWPIQEAGCSHFTQNYFRTAELQGVFRVYETIYYQWLPPQPVTQSLN